MTTSLTTKSKVYLDGPSSDTPHQCLYFDSGWLMSCELVKKVSYSAPFLDHKEALPRLDLWG
jgi:hypothetical protein